MDIEVAKKSVLIKTMLEDLGMDEDDDEAVPIPNVNAAILKLVIQWATYHTFWDPKECLCKDDENSDKDISIDAWDASFLKVDQATLFELIRAANYLDMKGLIDITCRTVVNLMKGKAVEELRQCFNITNDFTPTEEEQNLKESAEWYEEYSDSEVS